MKNPYKLDLPAVVSFSGGRTSAFMLRQILDAFGGQAPSELKVCFQNTGLEHGATYQFVEQVEERWAVPITWLEYDIDIIEDKPTARVVRPKTASRNGEPFDKLIDRRGYLPNPMTRICTSELKVRTLLRHLRTLPVFADGFTNAIGLRADEPRRAHRLKGDYGFESPVAPMFHAGHTEEDVLAFWKAAPFDLELPLTGNMAGNCVGCFLKSKGKLYTLEREMPRYFDWWIATEERMQGAQWTAVKESGRRFRLDRPSYALVRKQVAQQGELFSDLGDDDTVPCMCTD